MNTLTLAWTYLWSRPLERGAEPALLSLGLASITFLLLVGDQLINTFERDLKGIDVVLGARAARCN